MRDIKREICRQRGREREVRKKEEREDKNEFTRRNSSPHAEMEIL